MIIMRPDATQEQLDHVIKEVKKYGLKVDVSQGQFKTVIGLIGDERKIPFDHLKALPGVQDAFGIEIRYKLISREYNKYSEEVIGRKVIKVKNVEIGEDEPVIIAGPCAVESKDQLLRIAEAVKKAGAHILRGGIFKPRSSVYSFQGLGAEGWEEAVGASQWLRKAGDMFDMPVVTEIRGEAQIDLVAEYADILQIGARNMYNQDLLTKVAEKKKPILFKRHFGASIEEFLSFAEYIAAAGNKDIILCERGIIPIGKGKDYTRYTLDLAAVPVIQKETYLPIIVDPSHATGRRDLIFNMSCAAVAAGASGLMIEAHYNPAEALVDGPQMITPEELKRVIDSCKEIRKIMAERKK